jgi:signal transduction histidine kinase
MVLDAGFGLLIVAMFNVALAKGRGHAEFVPGPDWAHAVAGAAAFVVVTGRRKWPVPLLVFATVMSAVFILGTDQRHPLMTGAWMIVAYTVAVRTNRRRAWLVGGVSIAFLYLVYGLAVGVWFAPENLGASAWAVASIAIGDARRSRRAYIAEVENRARRAEETREEEARRRVAEERLRIARELHDVVAHHIAVINVQAGAAAHVLESRPEAVGPALVHIRRAADTVMQELASVVGVLRGVDEVDAATEPTRGLARLSELLDAFAAAGLRVEHRRRGMARELPAVVDLAAYRIVQESLTNAQKYGTGKATLTVTYTLEAVVVEVSNQVDPRVGSSGSGYGLVGMRERAAAAGGTVEAGLAPDGRFVVRAELPATVKEAS